MARLRLMQVITSMLLLAAAGLTTRAASLPDWAEDIVAAAPAVDTEISDQEFRVLFSERQITVDEDGVFTIRDRIAKQALSDHASDVGVESFFVGPGAKIRKSRAWHSAPGKRTKKSSRNDSVDISSFNSFLTDRSVRAVAIEGVRAGSIVFFEFKGEWKPYVLDTEYTFAYSSIVDRSRLVIKLPARWKIHSGWLHAEGVQPSINANTYTYEFTGLDYPIEEKLALSISDRAPLLHLGFEPPTDTGIPFMKDWTALGLWFEELSSNAGTLTPQIEAAASEAVGDAGAPPVEIALDCAIDVRDRVRYVAKSIGIGGYQPRSASETLGDLWGDCKDKATLLRAMLTASDLTAYPVLVSLSRAESVSETVPVLSAFDHMILAIALPESATASTRFATAILEDEQLGKLLIVDTTDEYTSIGWMSGPLSGRRALIVAGDKTHLITLPGKDPTAHRRDREMTIRVAEDGSATMTRTTRRYGAMARWHRIEYHQSQKQLRESVEGAIHDLWTGAQIEEVALVPEDEAGAFVETVRWSLDALPKGAEESFINPFSRAHWAVSSVPLSRRETPVVYEYPRRISSTVTIEGVSETSILPKDKLKDKDGWRVERAFSRDGTTVHASWSMDLEKTRFPIEESKNLKSFYRALRSISGVMISCP